MSLEEKLALAIRKKSVALLGKMEKRSLQLAQDYTPVDTRALVSSARIIRENQLKSILKWGDIFTGEQSVDYEGFVAYGTKYQVANPYHLKVADALNKEFSNDGPLGSIFNASQSSNYSRPAPFAFKTIPSELQVRL